MDSSQNVYWRRSAWSGGISDWPSPKRGRAASEKYTIQMPCVRGFCFWSSRYCWYRSHHDPNPGAVAAFLRPRLSLGRRLVARFGRRLFLRRRLVEAGGVEEPRPGRLLVLVRQRAVVRQLVRTPEDDHDEPEVDPRPETFEAALGRELDVHPQCHTLPRQHRPVQAGPSLISACMAMRAHEHGAEHEEKQCPLHPAVILPGVQDLDQEEDEAPDQCHDEERADGPG